MKNMNESSSFLTTTLIKNMNESSSFLTTTLMKNMNESSSFVHNSLLKETIFKLVSPIDTDIYFAYSLV